jgi:predicted ribosome quality control (RQC) complex YloA/Tae2 family protein
MSLTIEQMKKLLKEINSSLKEVLFDYCTAPHPQKIVLHFKEAPPLLICFQEAFLRFHLTQYSGQDTSSFFSKKLTQHLRGWYLKSCELVNEDRILRMVLKKGELTQTLISELIPKKPNCYLVDSQRSILVSLHPTIHTSYLPPKTLPPLLSFGSPEDITSASVEAIYRHKELEAEFLKKRNTLVAELKNKLNKARKAEAKFSEELEKALLWEKAHHEASLLQANLYKITKGLRQVSANDWLKDNREIILNLDPTLPPSEEVSKRFQKSKKLKKAIDPLSAQLKQAHQAVEKLSLMLEQVQRIETKQELESFCQIHEELSKKITKNKLAKKTLSLPYHEFVTQAGLKIWVGKNAHANDKLTFTYAHGSDYWLHARDVPGSHVILHLGKHLKPDEESLLDAIHAALFYSKAKERQEGEVCITQCKYVSRYKKNLPGKVHLSLQRITYAKIDLERLKKLKENKFTNLS